MGEVTEVGVVWSWLYYISAKPRLFSGITLWRNFFSLFCQFNYLDTSKIDLVFAVDTSSHVGRRRFNKEIQFLKDLIGYLPVFPTKIRIALVSSLKIEFNFEKYNNKECTIKGIKNIK